MKARHKVTNDITNIGRQTQANGNTSQARGGVHNEAAGRLPEDPCQGDGGGSPEQAPARQAMAEINTADVATQATDSSTVGDSNRGEMNQNGHMDETMRMTMVTHNPEMYRVTKSDTTQASPGNSPQLASQDSTPSQNPELRNSSQSKNTMDEHQNRARKKPRKSALKIATLNIKGAGSTYTKHKWNEISTLMIEERIDILAIQETHLTEDRKERLNKTYAKRLHFITTLDKSTPNKMGVAIVLNKKTTKWKQLSAQIAIQGRAIIV